MEMAKKKKKIFREKKKYFLSSLKGEKGQMLKGETRVKIRERNCLQWQEVSCGW